MGTEESDKPDPLRHIEDSLEWERPTQQRIRRIEASVAPASYPPASSVGRRWNPAGVMLVLGGVSALSVTLGAVVTPLLTKPDLTGYVKEERLSACETRLDERDKAREKSLDEERERTGKCYQALGDCRSQTGAQGVVIESMEKRRH